VNVTVDTLYVELSVTMKITSYKCRLYVFLYEVFIVNNPLI